MTNGNAPRRTKRPPGATIAPTPVGFDVCTPTMHNAPVARLGAWDIWRLTRCRNCGEDFKQLKSQKRRICKTCREVSKRGGKR